MKKERLIKNDKSQETAEFPELLKMFVAINKRAIITVYLALPIALILRFVFHIKLPFGILLPLFLFALAISVYLYLLRYKVENMEQMEDISMLYLFINLIFYTLIIHYTGGIEWIGVFIYFFLIVEANIVLPHTKSLLITLAAIVFYSSLGILEYLGVVNHHDFFIFQSYQNLPYLIFTIIACAVGGFTYISFITRNYSNVFRKISETLNKERKSLIEAQSQLEESRATLEVKVEARTKELKNLTEHLEEQVKRRTKELQLKVQELEKFQSFAVGRELRMIELKKEINNLKDKLKKWQKK